MIDRHSQNNKVEKWQTKMFQINFRVVQVRAHQVYEEHTPHAIEKRKILLLKMINM